VRVLQEVEVSVYLPPPWVWWLIGGTILLTLTLLTLRAAGRLIRAGWKTRTKKTSPPLEDVLTVLAAAVATSVSAQGMWRFTGDVLGLDGPLQVVLFAFVELAIVTSAVRARRSMRENYSAGVDGAAVWALAALTAILSSLDSRNFGETVFRLAAPLVAAWLWERGMALERRRRTGRSRINWRLTPERVLVRLGLAEASDRTAGDVDAHRRLKRVALAAKRVHQSQTAGASKRKQHRALARRDRALDAAVEHTDLARNATRQAELLDLVTALGGADSLSALLDTATAPWAYLDHPAITGRAPHTTGPAAEEGERAVADLTSWMARRSLAPTKPVALHAPASAAGETGDRPPQRTVDVAPERRLLVSDPDAETVADEEENGDQFRDQNGDRDDDRDKPDEQDNRRSEEWIRRQCRGASGVGRRPTKSEVMERYGFSGTWSWRRVQNVQARMASQGYTFEADGTVLAPTKAVAETDADVTAREQVPV
jgi:hypothetical protein